MTDINSIESNLNSYETDPQKVLEIILNTTAKNQAILETLIELNLTLMVFLNPSMDGDGSAMETKERILKNLAEIQAQIASRL